MFSLNIYKKYFRNISINIRSLKLNYNVLIVAIVVMQLLCPPIPIPGIGSRYRLSEYFILLLMFFWFFNSALAGKKKNNELSVSVFELYFFLFCLMGLISNFWGYFFAGTSFNVRDFSIFIQLFLYWGAFRIGSYFYAQDPKILKYFKHILFMVITLNIINFMQYFNILNFNTIFMPLYSGGQDALIWAWGAESRFARVIGTADHVYNYACILLLFLLFFLVSYLSLKKNNIKISFILLFLTFVLTAISYILVKERSTFVAGGVALIYIGLSSITIRDGIKLNSKMLKVWLVALLFFVVIVSLFGEGLISRFSKKQTFFPAGYGFQQLTGTQVRMSIWYMAFNRIKISPVFGLGQQTNEQIRANELSVSAGLDSRARFKLINSMFAGEVRALPHNEYLTIWQNFGIVGLLMYVLMFFHIFKKSYYLNNTRYYYWGLGLRAMIIILAVFSLTQGFLWDNQSAVIIMLIIGIVYRLIMDVKQDTMKGIACQ